MMLKVVIYVIIIKHAKFSYSSIASQLLPCVLQISCTWTVCQRLTFTAPFQVEAHLDPLKHLWWSCFAKIADVFRPLAIFEKKLHRPCLGYYFIYYYGIYYGDNNGSLTYILFMFYVLHIKTLVKL